MKQFLKIRLACSAVLLGLSLLAVAPAPAQARSCFTAPEARALFLRSLQQEFTVAALYCSELFPDSLIKPNYEKFVRRFGHKMEINAKSVRAAFTTVGVDLDGWMTKVANHASDRVFHDPDFCVRADQELEQSLTLKEDQLDLLAELSANIRYPVPLCDRDPTAFRVYDPSGTGGQ